MLNLSINSETCSIPTDHGHRVYTELKYFKYHLLPGLILMIIFYFLSGAYHINWRFACKFGFRTYITHGFFERNASSEQQQKSEQKLSRLVNNF